jgi:hypothetical protein
MRSKDDSALKKNISNYFHVHRCILDNKLFIIYQHMHKSVLQIYIEITASCFGVNTTSSGSLQLC